LGLAFASQPFGINAENLADAKQPDEHNGETKLGSPFHGEPPMVE
jgi:hypothetical protein